jgi:hypothetical protein
MKMKNISFKQLFLQKGERIALVIAVAITALMVIGFGLASALGGSSATANAEKIENLKKTAEQAWRSSRPGKEIGEIPPDLQVVEVKRVDPDTFACNTPFFQTVITEDRKWRKPEVLVADEFHAEVVRGALQTYMLEQNKDKLLVAVLTAKRSTEQTDEAKKEQEAFRKRFDSTNQQKKKRSLTTIRTQIPVIPPPGSATAPGRGDARFGAGTLPPGMLGRDSIMQGQHASANLAGDLSWVSIEKLKDSPGKLAETNLPVRMIVVTASFPYKAQLEEFRRALRYPSVEEMMNDPAVRPEFVGFKVKRRVTGPTGKVIQDWDDLDLETPIKFLRVRSVAVEPEDQDLERLGIIIRPNRLVMPLPVLARSQKYPEVHLQGIEVAKKDLEKELQGTEAAPPPPKSRFEDIGVFDEGDVPTRQPGAAGAGFDRIPQPPAAQGVVPPVRGGRPLPGGGGRPFPVNPQERLGTPGTPNQPNQKLAIPEKCLVRFFDPTVVPGRSYEYKIQIRMANPNHEQPERAAFKQLTEDPEIISPEADVAWKVGDADEPEEKDAKDAKSAKGVKKASKITVTDELLWYAVDPSDKPPAGAKAPPMTDQEKAVVQIHRWLDEQRTKPNQPASVPVGDWSVLERLVIHRGEYIGKVVEVEVPFFDSSLDKYAFAVHPDEQVERKKGRAARTIKHKGVPVDFATDPVRNGRALMVDYEGGERSYQSGTKTVKETGPVEMLVLSADGKLIVHNSRDDTDNKDRKERVDAWRTWLDQVRNQADSGPANQDNRLFTPRGGPASRIPGGERPGNNNQ